MRSVLRLAQRAIHARGVIADAIERGPSEAAAPARELGVRERGVREKGVGEEGVGEEWRGQTHRFVHSSLTRGRVECARIERWSHARSQVQGVLTFQAPPPCSAHVLVAAVDQ